MTYTDTYLSGAPAQIDAVIAANAAAPAIIMPVVLDGIAHCCIRTAAAPPALPEGAPYTLVGLTTLPETARLAVGVFAGGDLPPPAPSAPVPKAQKRGHRA